MKYIIILFATLLMMSIYPTFAGKLVDDDGDGIFCVLEDGENDGDVPIKFCGEDDQDKCDGIPNVSIDDDHCSMDKNNDGLFTLSDIAIINGYNDLIYPYYPNWEAENVPYTFGGYECFYLMKAVVYNNRLNDVGLPYLQRDLLFNIAPISVINRPGCISQYGLYHEYPIIR